MTESPHLNDDLRRKAERVIAGTQTGRYLKRDLARDLLAVTDALDAERAAHQQTRTALTDGVEAVTRALASLSPRFGASVLVHDLDRWSMEAQRVLGLAVAEADKPNDGNER